MVLRGLPLGMFFFATFLCACQHDPATDPTSPSLVAAEGALANSYVRADQTNVVTARVRLRAQLPSNTPKQPSNVALVMDTSGSMDGAPIAAARAAALLMVDSLADGDWLSVVAFGSTSKVLLPATVIDDDAREDAKAEIRKLVASGTTDLAGGLQAGLAEAQKFAHQGGVSRIVLLGDGVPNDASALPALAQSAASIGAPISALGLGADYDETVMGALAQGSGGSFHYVDEPSEVQAYFEAEVQRVKRVVAKNARLELHTGPGVFIQEIVGLPHTGDDRQMAVPLGDLAASDDRTIVVRLASSPHHAGAAVELMDVVVRWDDPTGGPSVEQRLFLGAKATGTTAELEGGRNQEVEETASLADAAARTLGAIETARKGAPEAAQAELQAAAIEAEAKASAVSSEALRAEAEALRNLAASLPAVAPSPSPAEAQPARAVRAAHEHALDFFQ